MTALPGTPLSDASGLSQARLNQALHQVGEYLRQLHALTAVEQLEVTAYGYLGEHHPLEPQLTWVEAVHVMWNKLLDGCYMTQEAQGMRDLLDLYIEWFDRPVTSSLLHMDVWCQNILIDDAGDVTGLVDFDRALWGDVEIEFAVLDYCGISEPAFWEGYGTPRDTSPEAMLRRQFYLLYELQKYMPIRIWRRNDPASARRYKQQSLALGVQLLSGHVQDLLA